MTPEQALSFVRDHGIVLASAKGPVPNVAEAIAGEPIRGSWWAHPKSHAIYAILQELEEATDILTCRVVRGKVTFVHRRLWPALVRLADCLPSGGLAQIHQEHTEAGNHLNRIVPFPDWVPPDVEAAAADLREEEALGMLGNWVSRVPRR